MMMLALDFLSPWMLLGLLAASIPIILHLLSAVRAPEVEFPTLRFLRLSMEKTARRRRLEHWLLLLLRSILLAMLALAVAEPILRSTQGFSADRRDAAVLVIDNSYSMETRGEGATRFGRAISEADKLLSGSAKPAQAQVLLTNVGDNPDGLVGDLAALRERVKQAQIGSGKAPLLDRLRQARKLLGGQSAPQKVIYLFTDLQKLSMDGIDQLEDLRKEGIPLMLVDCSSGQANNVGIADLEITGRKVVDQELAFTATLVNSGPTDRQVHVMLQLDGRPDGDPIPVLLQSAEQSGSRATVKFRRRIRQPGIHSGQVVLTDSDDLAADNSRRFVIDVADRVHALLVRGEGRLGGPMDMGMVLLLALDPYAGTQAPWSVTTRTITADTLDDKALAATQVAFFADVASFTAAQARGVVSFVRRGGTAVFFLGPAANIDNYNQQFVQAVPESGGLLPARLDKAVGQIGLTADAVKMVQNFNHPYLRDLFPTPGDFPDVLVQRYYRQSGGVTGVENVLATPAGEPIVSAKNFAQGRVILFATTASREWNNLCTTGLFLPIIDRICLEAGDRLGGELDYPAGAQVSVRPKSPAATAGSALNLTAPGRDGKVDLVRMQSGPLGQHAVVAANVPGIYQWQLAGAGPEDAGGRGAFAVNYDGAESDLAAVEPAAVARQVKADVFAGHTIEEVHAAASKAAAGDNLWDRLTVLVILLLVLEALVANRFRRGELPRGEGVSPS